MVVSWLSELLRLVESAFGQVGDATPIMVGKQYLAQGFGSGPRVLFVPDPDGKVVTPPQLSNDYVAGIRHSCEVYVRAPETGTDEERFNAAYALADRVVNALKWAGAARVTFDGQPFRDGSPSDGDAFGAELVFGFSYTRGVPKDDSIWRAAKVNTVSPLDPDRPDGDNDTTLIVQTAVDAA